MSVSGPFLQIAKIAGSVFVEVFSVQNFTGYIYSGNPFETDQIYHFAKLPGLLMPWREQ